MTKAGAGTLTLSGANTYDGGTTLSAGTLNIHNASAIGTGTFTITGGTFSNSSGGTIILSTKPGDVVLWRFGRCFSHGAFLCDNDQVAHSYLNEGVILDRLDAHKFIGREVKYFTLWDE